MTQDRELVVRALRRLAAETRKGQDPAAHPSVETLVAYHANELSPEQDRELQRHLAVCAECPGLILALDNFANLSEDGHELTPAGVDSAWEKVRQRLADEGWFQGEARGISWSWAALSPPRRLIATVAVVVLSFLGVYLVLYAPDRQPRVVDRPESSVPSRDLRPTERGSVQEIQIPATAERFYLEATPEGAPHSGYDVELWTGGAASRRQWTHRWQPKSGSADLILQVPRDFLPAGEYRLELHGVEGGHRVRETADERRFRLSYR